MASYDIKNPFLPVDSHGLSIIYDRGGSYNNFVTIMLWEYLNKCNGKMLSILWHISRIRNVS